MKKILHIINDYNHTKVHKNLINEISKSNINQQVFVPVKNKGFVGRNELQSDKVMFCYSEKLKNYHRFLFKNKINYLYEDLIRQVDVDQVSIIHASTLFSDGFLAYKLNRKFGVPYIVSVRGTDIFTFYKYRKDLLSKMNSVLKHSKKIVFISESNKRAFEELKFVVWNGEEAEFNDFFKSDNKQKELIDTGWKQSDGWLKLAQFDKSLLRNFESLYDSFSQKIDNSSLSLQYYASMSYAYYKTQ